MAHFTRSFVFTFFNDRVRISIRGSDDRVSEYYFQTERVLYAIKELSQDWGSANIIQFKRYGNNVWMRVTLSGMQKEIYSVPLSEYQVFVAEFISAAQEGN